MYELVLGVQDGRGLAIRECIDCDVIDLDLTDTQMIDCDVSKVD